MHRCCALLSCCAAVWLVGCDDSTPRTGDGGRIDAGRDAVLTDVQRGSDAVAGDAKPLFDGLAADAKQPVDGLAPDTKKWTDALVADAKQWPDAPPPGTLYGVATNAGTPSDPSGSTVFVPQAAYYTSTTAPGIGFANHVVDPQFGTPIWKLADKTVHDAGLQLIDAKDRWVAIKTITNTKDSDTNYWGKSSLHIVSLANGRPNPASPLCKLTVAFGAWSFGMRSNDQDYLYGQDGTGMKILRLNVPACITAGGIASSIDGSILAVWDDFTNKSDVNGNPLNWPNVLNCQGAGNFSTDGDHLCVAVNASGGYMQDPRIYTLSTKSVSPPAHGSPHQPAGCAQKPSLGNCYRGGSIGPVSNHLVVAYYNGGGTVTIANSTVTRVSGQPFDTLWNSVTIDAQRSLVLKPAGTVTVASSVVTRVSGNSFSSDWAGKSIAIGGTTYHVQTVTNGTSMTLLEAGVNVGTAASYSLSLTYAIASVASADSLTLKVAGLNYPSATTSQNPLNYLDLFDGTTGAWLRTLNGFNSHGTTATWAGQDYNVNDVNGGDPQRAANCSPGIQAIKFSDGSRTCLLNRLHLGAGGAGDYQEFHANGLGSWGGSLPYIAVDAISYVYAIPRNRIATWSAMQSLDGTVLMNDAQASGNCSAGGGTQAAYCQKSSGVWKAISTASYPLQYDWASNWGLFSNEIYLVSLNGSPPRHMVHHKSLSVENYYAWANGWTIGVSPYWSSPRVSVSRSGKYMIFDSTWGGNDGIAVYAAQIMK